MVLQIGRKYGLLMKHTCHRSTVWRCTGAYELRGNESAGSRVTSQSNFVSTSGLFRKKTFSLQTPTLDSFAVRLRVFCAFVIRPLVSCTRGAAFVVAVRFLLVTDTQSSLSPVRVSFALPSLVSLTVSTLALPVPHSFGRLSSTYI